MLLKKLIYFLDNFILLLLHFIYRYNRSVSIESMRSRRRLLAVNRELIDLRMRLVQLLRANEAVQHQLGVHLHEREQHILLSMLEWRGHVRTKSADHHNRSDHDHISSTVRLANDDVARQRYNEQSIESAAKANRSRRSS